MKEYRVLKAFSGHKDGEIIQLEEERARMLFDIGRIVPVLPLDNPNAESDACQ